jgi:hypothetical protein
MLQKRDPDICGWENGESSKARHHMSEEPLHTDLDTLTEETARKIIWTLQPGTSSGSPLLTIKQLLYNFLDAAREQEYQEALRQQLREEQDQQN